MRSGIFANLLVGAAVSTAAAIDRRVSRSSFSRDITVIYKNADFSPEADIWYSNAKTPGSIGDLFAKNITIPGLSPLFPDVHCLKDGSVCQLTTGESEINAATSITALMLAPLFDLKKTYFLIGGIAGINPKYGTLADVAFSKYAVQVALQYEFDAREIPENFTNGYVPQGSTAPDMYPQTIYGTEVFELNEALRDIAAGFASTAKLNDTLDAVAYRSNYVSKTSREKNVYASALRKPQVIKCDTTTSDVYYSGTLLGEAFENTTRLWTNGSGIYCMTAQEDNATLEAMIRFAVHKTIDFARVIIMRTASDFDRPYPGSSPQFNLFYSTQGAFEPAVANIYLAGTEVVRGILSGWKKTFDKGVKPMNYVGDILGTLGGTPDFGPGIAGGVKVGFGKRGAEETEERPKTRGDMYMRGRVGMKGRLGAEVARRTNGAM
ncbi:related to purine nucleoside permease [Rhynchosporium secalis]|uniref:Related to purine nucleoside permease n=1 Tax=Rhynchosporium secalis TaxID=38038 RepID=A0A1E1M6Z3_RHYSE|nr:related to purine nucleoside permease [Rhynchosporium secalis]